MFNVWDRLYPGEAKDYAGKLPPRPLRGRWGHITRFRVFVKMMPKALLLCSYLQHAASRSFYRGTSTHASALELRRL